MALSTPLSERIGIELPFMQSGMGGIGPITLARLAAAISNAGALGTLAHPAIVLEEPGVSGERLAELVQDVVRQVREGIRLAVSLTDKPLAINVRIAQEQPDAPEVLKAILEERERDPKVKAQLRVLTTSGGHPRMYGMNDSFRESGMLHFHAVSNVRHALSAQAEGMDGVIATGFEAAGHVGHHPVHTFVLVPSIAAAVDIPVLCAGGVVDGAALAGALTLGAQMGYIGSRFLAAEECEYNDGNKKFIVEASETQTEVVPAFFGPGRFIENGFTAEVQRLVDTNAPYLERIRIEGAAMRRGAMEGDLETGMMVGGQGIGRIKSILSAGEIVRQIHAEAEQALMRAGGFVTSVAAAVPEQVARRESQPQELAK
ncbi:NAD(P)H-dependent flavin oxidoreductase [Saccharopolyspora phatthalungensis]|uniref:Enoyl-[acyl-carrier protein] reductase II n=1 Tax=Saccharopolyspora phatthalungensis TaxID=664693 RepID=A0A840QKH2_9PSEU|nr:nitronate monooxygenase family protein [Saccharopolyspora phatthalungensis]MBB5160019.1 enoyl-[acyl-carrier protein] reductase II [Saccharopolyspora phatthalungensis]